MKLQCAFLQIHFLSISSSSSLHCLLPFQYNSSSKPFYCIRHIMVLIYLIYVIMKEYTLSRTEIFYTVNRHGIQFAVLYRPNSSYCSEYLFITLMFNPLKHNHDTKESLKCHSFPVSLFALFNPL